MRTPEGILKEIMDVFPDINKRLMFFYKQIDNKNKNVFIPISGWNSIISSYKPQGVDNIPHNLAALMMNCLTWQYNKSVYKINSCLFDCIIKSDINRELPIDILYKIPYHSIYIELGGKEISTYGNVHGFWITINNFDITSDHKIRNIDVLYFYINSFKDGKNATDILSIPLKKQSLRECLELILLDGVKEEEIKSLLDDLNIFLSLTIYICSNEPDIIEKEKNQKEHIPIIKTRHGLKLLPAPKVRIFNVGDEIAKKIQEVNDYESSDRSVRAHIRKAHWHGYWVGKGRTEFKYNWIFPTLVNVEND